MYELKKYQINLTMKDEKMSKFLIFLITFVIMATLVTSGIMIVIDQFINYKFFQIDWLIIIVLSVTITVFTFGSWYIKGEDE